ncbi:Fic family protein [Candidatus Saccharibacteria bacterium]|nr:Fic family protein [Candidatus Saccharibacteria bacterium]
MQTYDPILDNDSPENKQKYWEVAFGLQAVDNLKPSSYVRSLAREHTAGTKSYAEVTELTRDYYNKHNASPDEHEADIVAEAIYDILHDGAFRFDITTLKSYHYRLFQGLDRRIYHPGEFRTVNLTKREAILGGRSVQYQDYGLITESLEYDFSEQSRVDYIALSQEERGASLSNFTSHIWQVHPFYEGNTRTTAVFIEKYLLSLGYEIDNEIFRDHSKAFRNALVLANYSNIPEGIQANPVRLMEFFGKILEK